MEYELLYLKLLPILDINIGLVYICMIIHFLGMKKSFLALKVILSSTKNKILDVNKTYIDISNGQKFELSKH